jgi:hypothetical protein
MRLRPQECWTDKGDDNAEMGLFFIFGYANEVIVEKYNLANPVIK